MYIVYVVYTHCQQYNNQEKTKHSESNNTISPQNKLVNPGFKFTKAINSIRSGH